jgi:energy-coupling factor transporter ATP-binding protein EcfA2
VSAWEVVTAREARSRLEVEAERGLTALVWREREMAAFWDCFEKARAGQGQMVFIVGEPGIGKSRLVESNNDVTSKPSSTSLVRGRSKSFSRQCPTRRMNVTVISTI